MIDVRGLLNSGGEWLGRARAWMQAHKHNGSRVTWGSTEPLLPPVTVRELEEVAAHAAAAAFESTEYPKLLDDLQRCLYRGLLRKGDDLPVSDDFDVNQVLQRLDRLRPKV
jgi:hypothetical protein